MKLYAVPLALLIFLGIFMAFAGHWGLTYWVAVMTAFRAWWISDAEDEEEASDA